MKAKISILLVFVTMITCNANAQTLWFFDMEAQKCDKDTTTAEELFDELNTTHGGCVKLPYTERASVLFTVISCKLGTPNQVDAFISDTKAGCERAKSAAVAAGYKPATQPERVPANFERKNEKRSNCNLKNLPKELASIPEIKYATKVEKGMGLPKKTVVGYAAVTGENCNPIFVENGGSVPYTNFAGYVSSGLEPCDLREAGFKIDAVIGNAALKFAGWKPVGNALSNPEHYTKKWNRDLKPICSDLTPKKAKGCVGSCKKLFDDAGRNEFCNRVLPNLLKVDSKSECRACCQ